MNKIKYAVLVLTIVFGVGTVDQKEAAALSCMRTSFPEYLEGMEVVFEGEVTSSNAKSATFQVREYWKGQAGSTITVGAEYWDGTPNPPAFFEVGGSYLVFALRDSNGQLAASISCGRTRQLSVAGEERLLLGEGNKVVDKPAPVTKPTPAAAPEQKPESKPEQSTTTPGQGDAHRSVVAKFVLWFKGLFR